MNDRICGECGDTCGECGDELTRCDECEVLVCYSCIHLNAEGEYLCDACWYTGDPDKESKDDQND